MAGLPLPTPYPTTADFAPTSEPVPGSTVQQPAQFGLTPEDMLLLGWFSDEERSALAQDMQSDALVLKPAQIQWQQQQQQQQQQEPVPSFLAPSPRNLPMLQPASNQADPGAARLLAALQVWQLQCLKSFGSSKASLNYFPYHCVLNQLAKLLAPSLFFCL